MIAKSITIKRRGGRSGGCVVKAVRLTSGDLHRVPESGLGKSQDFLTAVQKSAEGKVGEETGKVSSALQCRKAQPTDRPSRNVSTPKARTVPARA